MKTLRIVLLVYCALATLALGAYIFRQVSLSHRLDADLTELLPRVSQASDETEAALTKLKGLEAKQRQERGDYSGPEAVDASYTIQQAQQTYAEADAHEEALAQQAGLLQDELEQEQGRIVPAIALLLLHFTGFFVFIGKRAISDY